MKRILLILLLPLVAGAQYSRWNYSDAQPLNAAADKTMRDFYTAAIVKSEGTVYFWERYEYKNAPDSAFEYIDLDDGIVRLFDPTDPMPRELERENTLYSISHHRPVKVKGLIGRDEMLGKNVQPRPVNGWELLAARKEAQALRKAVEDTMKIDKKLKRKKAWVAVKKAKKDKKIKDSR